MVDTLGYSGSISTHMSVWKSDNVSSIVVMRAYRSSLRAS